MKGGTIFYMGEDLICLGKKLLAVPVSYFDV
jgi:hypothetical protein